MPAMASIPTRQPTLSPVILRSQPKGLPPVRRRGGDTLKLKTLGIPYRSCGIHAAGSDLPHSQAMSRVVGFGMV